MYYGKYSETYDKFKYVAVTTDKQESQSHNKHIIMCNLFSGQFLDIGMHNSIEFISYSEWPYARSKKKGIKFQKLEQCGDNRP